MLSLQFCEPRGMNMAVPLETLHVICLGYMVHLLQGFSQIQKLVKTTKEKQSEEEKGTHYVFSGDYQTEAKSQLIVIGEYLTHQPDPNSLRTNFPSGYLIELDKKKKDSSSGKKQGHEMHGMLLTLLFYMLLTESANN